MSQITLFQQAAAPGTPAAGQIVLYAKTDDRFYWEEDTGTEHKLAHSGEAETFGAITSTGLFSVTVGDARAAVLANTSPAGANTVLDLWNKATSGDNVFLQFLSEAGGTVRGKFSYDRVGDKLRIAGAGTGLLISGSLSLLAAPDSANGTMKIQGTPGDNSSIALWSAPTPAFSTNRNWSIIQNHSANGRLEFYQSTSATGSPTAGNSIIRLDSTGVDLTGTLTTSGIVTAGGRVNTPASTTSSAGLRLPHGAAPTSPVDGDEWTTTAGKFVRINGVTKAFTLT